MMATTFDAPTSNTGDDNRVSGLPDAWCMTVLYHPDPARIGAQFRWSAQRGLRVNLSRQEPEFRPFRDGQPEALGLSQLSRSPLSLRNDAQGVSLESENGRVRFELDDRPGTAHERIPTRLLRRGVRLNLGQSVSLLLHSAPSSVIPRGADLGMMGVSDALVRVRAEIIRLGSQDLPVLITGESGVGKELVARAIHQHGRRAERRLVSVNMAALPASTATAELFGHARGAFTGATEARPGLFREAAGGTIFLDELGETPLEIQPMLLRAIDSHEIQPLGLLPQRIDVRVIAATDADLEALTTGGHFKRPLLYRLSATTLHVPPLRERPADIPLLFIHFLREALTGLEAGHRLAFHEARQPWLRRRDILTLLRYPWPGNIRELRNVAFQTASDCFAQERSRLPEQFMAALKAHEAQHQALSVGGGNEPGSDFGIDAGEGLEREPSEAGSHLEVRAPVRLSTIDERMLRDALEACDWQILPTSQRLGISRKSTYLLMSQHAIRHAGAISGEEILKASSAIESLDPERIAAGLQVSARALRMRMRALGLIS